MHRWPFSGGSGWPQQTAQESVASQQQQQHQRNTHQFHQNQLEHVTPAAIPNRQPASGWPTSEHAEVDRFNQFQMAPGSSQTSAQLQLPGLPAQSPSFHQHQSHHQFQQNLPLRGSSPSAQPAQSSRMPHTPNVQAREHSNPATQQFPGRHHGSQNFTSAPWSSSPAANQAPLANGATDFPSSTFYRPDNSWIVSPSNPTSLAPGTLPSSSNLRPQAHQPRSSAFSQPSFPSHPHAHLIPPTPSSSQLSPDWPQGHGYQAMSQPPTTHTTPQSSIAGPPGARLQPVISQHTQQIPQTTHKNGQLSRSDPLASLYALGLSPPYNANAAQGPFNASRAVPGPSQQQATAQKNNLAQSQGSSSETISRQGNLETAFSPPMTPSFKAFSPAAPKSHGHNPSSGSSGQLYTPHAGPAIEAQRSHGEPSVPPPAAYRSSLSDALTFSPPKSHAHPSQSQRIDPRDQAQYAKAMPPQPSPSWRPASQDPRLSQAAASHQVNQMRPASGQGRPQEQYADNSHISSSQTSIPHQQGFGSGSVAFGPGLFSGAWNAGHTVPPSTPPRSHPPPGILMESPDPLNVLSPASGLRSGVPSASRLPSHLMHSNDGSPLALQQSGTNLWGQSPSKPPKHPFNDGSAEVVVDRKFKDKNRPPKPKVAQVRTPSPGKKSGAVVRSPMKRQEIYVDVPSLPSGTWPRERSAGLATPRSQETPSNVVVSGPVDQKSRFKVGSPLGAAADYDDDQEYDDQWDSADAEGSDYESDDVDLILTSSSGQNKTPSTSASRGRRHGTMVRISGGLVKSATRRAPTQRLSDLMEDLFEADDSLPDRSDLANMDSSTHLPPPSDQFFELQMGTGVPKSSVLRDLQRAIRAAARIRVPSAGGRAASASPEKQQIPGAPARLSDLDPQRLGRLLRIVERAVRIAENVEVLPVMDASSAVASRAKAKTKRKANGQGKARGANKRARGSSGSASRSPARDSDATPPLEEEDQDAHHNQRASGGFDRGDASASMPGRSPSAAASSLGTPPLDDDPVTQQLALSGRINLITYGVLAADCCLTILTGDELPKHLASEDIVRPAFDAIKHSLERAILPFIEACAGGGSNAVHPLLHLLVHDLAPTAAKKGRTKASTKSGKHVADPAESGRNPGAQACADAFARLFKSTCSALGQIQRLVKLQNMALSESLVISAVYAGIQPFFVLEPESGGLSEGKSEAAKGAARGRQAMTVLGAGLGAMRSLRLPCLNLLRNVFARHQDMRQWIVEEILTSLIKLPDMRKSRRQHALRTGKSIHSVTALLLQLIQAASQGRAVAFQSSIFGSRQSAHPDSRSANQNLSDEERDEDGVRLEIGQWSRALDGAKQAAREVAAYLMQRVNSSGKVVKTGSDNSYAAIVENLVNDLLATLFLPEWPAAGLLLTSLCRSFIASLDDPKSTPDARGVALDQIGPVAARLQEIQLRIKFSGKSEHGHQQTRAIPTILEIERSLHEGQLDLLNGAYAAVLEHLAAAESDDQAAETASEFTLSQWGCELAAALVRASDACDAAEREHEEEGEDPAGDGIVIEIGRSARRLERIQTFISALARSLTNVGERAGSRLITQGNVFETRSEEDYRAILLVCEEVGASSAFMVTQEYLVRSLITALDGQAVGNRTRALRSLGRSAVVDDNLLDDVDIRAAIETRLYDESASVREAALALLGRYALRLPERLESQYPVLCERVNDAGLSVRKRALRLLASIYATSRIQSTRIDACVRIVRCVFDEDNGMQELAVGTIGSLWLNLAAPSEGKPGRPKSGAALLSSKPEEEDVAEAIIDDADDAAVFVSDTSFEGKIQTLIAVAGLIREKPSPLEAVLERIMSRCEPAQAPALLARLRELSDAMVDSLVDAHELQAKDVVERIRTVHLLASTNPSIITIAKARALQPFLKSASTPEDYTIMEYLLRIFRACLPHMPKTALSFAESLEQTMTPLVSKPPAKPAAPVLQELIAAYCTVIKTHTHHYQYLIKTLRLCLHRLRAVRNTLAANPDTKPDATARLLMSMIALLCEHADFDKIASEDEDRKHDLRALCGEKSVVEEVFALVLGLYQASPDRAFQTTALQSLGFMFRAHPGLITKDSTRKIMSRVFRDGDAGERDLLLRIVREFLTSEQRRSSPEAANAKNRASLSNSATLIATPQKVEMNELIGNTETFADTGVSAALIQAYLSNFLEAARDVYNPSIQRTGMDILKFTVHQGVSHPLQCVPTLIALETVPDTSISAKALALHDYLSSKHASILAARYLDFAKESFDYQTVLQSNGPVRGHRFLERSETPVAALRGWYSLLRDKRNTRLDFLRAVVKALDVNTASGRCSGGEVLFARYIAENLAALEYKTLEEVFSVIGFLRTILSVTGMMIHSQVEDELNREDSGDEEDFSEDADAIEVDEMTSEGPQNQGNPADFLDGHSQALSSELSSVGDFSQLVDLSQPRASTRSGQRRKGGTLATSRAALVMGVALLLRNHLKRLYNLSEEKCKNWQPNKRQSSGADRPATRKLDGRLVALNLEALQGAVPLSAKSVEPFVPAVDENMPNDDMETPPPTQQSRKQVALVQMASFEQLVREEGTLDEPDDKDDDWM
ncbi:hypothetical protein IE81DRAFT_167089 [Ceraceosorus guamensis]|uniref:Sister chromatid cohesion protein n=1 Tax=Ceraceosorus guamensis TaxID=1522189 RepID=A0A316W809_9BASI|nr:hypothetical protein IE81DRAFT_167089 [Ceraceosorus guamensis]PWN45724.1 hypothetical protein IE81DRAFT_167089 [Ceraceosorus guamensis]